MTQVVSQQKAQNVYGISVTGRFYSKSMEIVFSCARLVIPPALSGKIAKEEIMQTPIIIC